MKKIVILVSGKISSGKNTFTDFLKEDIESRYNTPVATDYFARLLKEMCRDSFRPLSEYLNTELLAGGPNSEWISDESWFEKKTPITRMILQIVGSEIVRTVNKNFWSESFVERANERKEFITINSDCRFPSEIEHVQKNFDVVKIRVEREMDRNGSINEHVSEKALDDYHNWDYVIHNNGTLDELKAQTKYITNNLVHYFEEN